MLFVAAKVMRGIKWHYATFQARAIRMNSYDSKHLRLMNLIRSQQWAAIGGAEIHELKVLIACKYVTLHDKANGRPSLELNPEGQHPHRRLVELESRQNAMRNHLSINSRSSRA